MMPLPERLVAALADRYRLERELGQGGMATVYLAEDLKHHRQVAIKVLKPELAAVLGAERFVQEITTTAALQHPHILPLFDSGSADGFLFYVMPYIQGETLRDKLNRETQFGIEEAVGIATDVADALDYAHRQGVIHRDIKPENILLHDGRPMVADFGIALALSAAAGGRMTETGLSLGTPHYMSPEQATAEKEISARADVYSLGSVLYEMLTGDPPHTGASAQQIIMKIVTEDARPVTQVRKSVPPNVAAAVAISLEKLPADRFASAAEFARALRDPGFAFTATRAQGAAARAGGLGRFPWWQVGAAAALLLVAGLAGGLLLSRPGAAPREVVRFMLRAGPGFHLLQTSYEGAPFAVSPDGKTIVFVGEDSTAATTRLYLRPVDQLMATPIPGTEDAVAPFFSADGRWIGFATRESELLRKIAVTGGPPLTLAENVQNQFASASWGDDGSIVYVSSRYHLSRVSGSGGPTEVLGDSLAIPGLAFWPHLLPGSRAVLFQLCSARCSTTDLALFDLDRREGRVLVKGATQGWYLPTGHLLYATTTGALFAVTFDLRKLSVTGDPVPLLDNIRTVAADGARLALSPAGTLVYLPGGPGRTEVRFAVVDLNDGREALIGPPGDYAHPRWSPDGEHLAVTQYAESQQGGQIALYDIPSRTLSQLTFQGENVRPSWSPDGRRLAFSTNRNGETDIWWAPADGSDPGERVAEGPDVDGNGVTAWTPDGAYIVVDGVSDDEPGGDNEGVSEDVWAIATTAPRKMIRAVATAAEDESGVVSPDGRWIAYNSNPTGNTQVYVRPFLKPGPVALISTGGGTEPVWLSDRELVYHDLRADSLMVATLEYGASIRVLGRRAIADYRRGRYRQGGRSYQGYDVLRKARRLVLLRSTTPEESTDPVVVLHWADELKARFAEQGAVR